MKRKGESKINPEAILAIVGAAGVFLGALINYKRREYNGGGEEL